MPKFPLKSSAMNARIDWGRAIGTLTIEIAVLLAILGAAIRYIDWTSDAAQAEFMSAGKPTVSAPQSRQPENSSKLRCDHREPR